MNNGMSAVLLVSSDERITKGIIPVRLAELGESVAVISGCSAGLEPVRAHQPSVILLDLAAVANCGMSVVTQLKEAEDLRDVPVILLAPPELVGEVERCLAAGAEDYVLAPFSPALVKAHIRDYMEVRRHRHQRREREKQEELLKIERDVQIARQIQLSFLPHELPRLPGWEFCARFEPAREVAGDFYDVFTISQGRRAALVIADVCDKGVGAALFMALIRSLLRAFSQQHYAFSWTDALGEGGARTGRREAPSTGTMALRNAIALTNTYITDNHMDLNMFATLFFGLLDPATGQLAYINCGHNPPLILSADGGLKAHLRATGPAVGMIPDAPYQIAQAQLDPGDTLFCFTDGVTEARAPDKTFFGDKRLEALVARPISQPQELLDGILHAVHDFTGGPVRFDDITMLAARRDPSASGVARSRLSVLDKL